MEQLSDYDYSLPESLIAKHPAAQRPSARLLIVDRQRADIVHSRVDRLIDFLDPGDCLVFNNTRVLPARLFGSRIRTGGKWEGLYIEQDVEGRWKLMCRTRGKLLPGESIRVVPAHGGDQEFELKLDEPAGDGCWWATTTAGESVVSLLSEFGTLPLPPYIQRSKADQDDWDRYQTVFAERPGAVAAPTAGLHFSDGLLADLRQAEIGVEFVTLHVGIGTFRPIACENLAEHRMHSEWCELDAATAQRLRQVRSRGKRIVSVGTTTVRTLESAAADGRLEAWTGTTDLFIRPPYAFQAVDVLFTNFHLPKSSLLVLVSAFAGRELILRAYREAIAEQYRFFSYGDAMLIL